MNKYFITATVLIFINNMNDTNDRFSHFVSLFGLIDFSAFPFQPKLSVVWLSEGRHRTMPIKFLVKRASSRQEGLNDDYQRHPYTINLESAIVIDTDSMTREKDSLAEGKSLFLALDTRIYASAHRAANTRGSVHNINLCAITDSVVAWLDPSRQLPQRVRGRIAGFTSNTVTL